MPANRPVVRHPHGLAVLQRLRTPPSALKPAHGCVFAARLLNNNPPLVYEDGRQQRDFVRVHDVARACRLALETEAAGGRVFNIGRLEWMRDPWDDVRRSGERLLEIEAGFRPDLVHLNTFADGALGRRAPAVGHSCVLSRWRAVHCEAAPPAWDRYRREVRKGLQAASLVAAPSRAMLAWLESDYGPLPSTRVIPNARDQEPSPRSP